MRIEIIKKRDNDGPAIGRCTCGCAVYLDHPTNTCEDCGRDYNLRGTLLAPREQWGYETGETAADILGPRYDPDSMF